MAVAYASVALTGMILATCGPPGWAILATEVAIGTMLTFGINYLDSIVFK